MPPPFSYYDPSDHGPQGIGISQECWYLQRDLFIGEISHNASFLKDRPGIRRQQWVSDGQDYTLTQLLSYAYICPLFKSKPGVWTLKTDLEGRTLDIFVFPHPSMTTLSKPFLCFSLLLAALTGPLRAGELSIVCQGSRNQTLTLKIQVTRTSTPKHDTLSSSLKVSWVSSS